MTRNFTHNSNFLFSSDLFGEEIIYAVQECNLPGLSFSHVGSQTNSSVFFLQGDTMSFSDLSISIIIDEELVTWKKLVQTMLGMREQYSGTSEEIQHTAYLEIQDDQTNTILKLEFWGCRLESIGDLNYNATSEDEIITLPLTIKYDYYTII